MQFNLDERKHVLLITVNVKYTKTTKTRSTFLWCFTRKSSQCPKVSTQVSQVLPYRLYSEEWQCKFGVAGLSLWIPICLFTRTNPVQGRKLVSRPRTGHVGSRPQCASSSLLWTVCSDECGGAERAALPGWAADLEPGSLVRAWGDTRQMGLCLKPQRPKRLCLIFIHLSFAPWVLLSRTFPSTTCQVPLKENTAFFPVVWWLNTVIWIEHYVTEGKREGVF